MDKPCTNCGGTGWVGYEFPTSGADGKLYMRQRINPCHICNAGGSWKQWAQNVVDVGQATDARELKEREKMKEWQPPTDADVIWALQQGSKPGGFCPNAASVADLLKSLELSGFVYSSERGQVWTTTDKGFAELVRLSTPAERGES